MIPFLLILLAFGLDRVTKLWATAYLAEQGPIRLHPLLSLSPAYNRGIAFGLAQGIGTIVGWLSVLVLLGLIVYMQRLPRWMKLQRVGLAVMIGGALGNLVDRVTVGQVFDFISTPLRPGVFNVADVMIYTGIIIAVAGAVFQRVGSGHAGEAMQREEGPPAG
jgi:signal peptidase II